MKVLNASGQHEEEQRRTGGVTAERRQKVVSAACVKCSSRKWESVTREILSRFRRKRIKSYTRTMRRDVRNIGLSDGKTYEDWMSTKLLRTEFGGLIYTFDSFCVIIFPYKCEIKKP